MNADNTRCWAGPETESREAPWGSDGGNGEIRTELDCWGFLLETRMLELLLVLLYGEKHDPIRVSASVRFSARRGAKHAEQRGRIGDRTPDRLRDRLEPAPGLDPHRHRDRLEPAPGLDPDTETDSSSLIFKAVDMLKHVFLVGCSF